MAFDSGARGFCLSSVEIRKLIEEKRIIVPEFNESRIQPSSFEPTIDDKIYRLDAENGIFRSDEKNTVRRSLLEQIPGLKREKIDISGGHMLSAGFSYLIPLREKVILEPNQQLKSSPKSSFGRVFLNTRLFADYNPSFDEVSGNNYPGAPLDLWLLVQPLAFNVIVHPGLCLNQLRFIEGYDALLNNRDLIEEFKKNPLLYERRGGKLIPAKPRISDSLKIHLDLLGKDTGGVVGLMAIRNPEPIDLSKKAHYDVERFFEPIMSKKGKIIIRRGEHYLFASEEFLKIPSHLNVELAAYSQMGINGPLHFAGFIDNKFEGDLVFEVRSDEITDMLLTHGMAISKLNVFRTAQPDKLYGASIGSNYKGQVGPKPAKVFKELDYNFAGEKYKKLRKHVLVQDAKTIEDLVGDTGFKFLGEGEKDALEKLARKGFFHTRYACETDEEVLQIIPYIIIIGPNDTVFSYVRAENMVDFGEKRLFGKRSIGVGGHIQKKDYRDYTLNCLFRELNEEVVSDGKFDRPKLIGTILAKDNPVDRVHFGMVYVINTEKDVRPKDPALKVGSFTLISELMKNVGAENWETWSRLLVPHLPKIYELGRS